MLFAGFPKGAGRSTVRDETQGMPKGRIKVTIKKFAGVLAAAAVMFGLGAVPEASATDGQAFGLQQTVTDPSGGEIGYTVTKFLPSTDAVPYTVSGQLYEVTVRADALNGMPIPVISGFSARSESGQSYPALAGVWTPQGLSGATLLPGGSSTGKIYFDAVGEPPTSVVYSGGGKTLTWIGPSSTSSTHSSSEGASGASDSAGDNSDGATAGEDSGS